MSIVDTSRRRVLAAGIATAVTAKLSGFSRLAHAADESLMTRPIPHSGEEIPVIGIGTAVIFDFENDAAKYAERRDVIQKLVAAGGRLIDTAHSYGRAEDRVGDLAADLGVRDKLFLATKYSYAADRNGANTSMQASLDSIDRICSPSLRPMSAIERSITVVDTGSSIASAESPKAPPTAPVAASVILCSVFAAGPSPRSSIVATATSRARVRALRAATLSAPDQLAGSSSSPFSIGVPSRLVSRAARLGCSSSVRA